MELTPEEKRMTALKWWEYKDEDFQCEMTSKYFEGRSYTSLSGREIQKIYEKEIPCFSY